MIQMELKEVIDLVEDFGLYIEYNQWAEKGWVRIKSENNETDFGEKADCLILYKDDSRVVMCKELRNSLVRMGQRIQSRKLKELLNI
jgi:hypothetical protein